MTCQRHYSCHLVGDSFLWNGFKKPTVHLWFLKGIFAEGEYENFFVCNYGVGGNVPGEPVYEMDCQDDDKEKSDNNEKTVQMLNQMEIKFKERFTEATEQVNTLNMRVFTKCYSNENWLIKSLRKAVLNPIPTGCCHLTLIYGLIPPMAGRNRVNL